MTRLDQSATLSRAMIHTRVWPIRPKRQGVGAEIEGAKQRSKEGGRMKAPPRWKKWTFRSQLFASAWLSMALGGSSCFAQGLAQRQQPPFWQSISTHTAFEKHETATLAKAQAAIESLARAKGPHTIQNTLEPFDTGVLH